MLLLLTSTVALSVLPASAQTPPPGGGGRPPDPRVLVVGDSVSLGAQGAIVAELSAHGWSVTQVSRESLHTHEARAIADAHRAAIGEVVVVQLGTNDGMDPGLFAKWIDGLMGHLRDVRRVFWVNLRNFAPWVPAANAAIAAAAARWPNLRIVNWDAAASPDPSLVYADGYHLNALGQVALAQLLAVTLDAYVAERLTPPTTLAPREPQLAFAPGPVAGGAGADDPAPMGMVVLALAVGLAVCGAAMLWARPVGARPRKPVGARPRKCDLVP